jgi:hypothetical protein
VRIVADHRYTERRKVIDDFFVPENRIVDFAQVIESPCGKYRLEICRYSTGPKTWNYSRGIIKRKHDDQIVADIKRNYGQFWHAWVQHPNGNDYMLCGEDYQGYSVVNLTTGTSHVYFPDAGCDGWGFCWTAVYPSPDRLMLAVDGCYWACPYEVVFVDFRSPEQLPLPELARSGDLVDCEGWLDNDTFAFTREYVVRKSDGAPYDSLTAEDQEVLDNASSTEERKERTLYKRPSVGFVR